MNTAMRSRNPGDHDADGVDEYVLVPPSDFTMSFHFSCGVTRTGKQGKAEQNFQENVNKVTRSHVICFEFSKKPDCNLECRSVAGLARGRHSSARGARATASGNRGIDRFAGLV